MIPMRNSRRARRDRPMEVSRRRSLGEDQKSDHSVMRFVDASEEVDDEVPIKGGRGTIVVTLEIHGGRVEMGERRPVLH
jgi:hypothetical protein